MKHTERQSMKHYLARKRVMQVLDLSDGQYFNLQFENGYAYLKSSERYKDTDLIKDLVNCKIFWAWWKNQYSIFDSRFLHQFDNDNRLYSETKKELLDYYNELQIQKNVYPGRSLLNFMLREIEDRANLAKQSELTSSIQQ